MGLQKRDVSVRQIDAATWDWITAEAGRRNLRFAEVIEELVELRRRVDRATGEAA